MGKNSTLYMQSKFKMDLTQFKNLKNNCVLTQLFICFYIDSINCVKWSPDFCQGSTNFYYMYRQDDQNFFSTRSNYINIKIYVLMYSNRLYHIFSLLFEKRQVDNKYINKNFSEK